MKNGTLENCNRNFPQMSRNVKHFSLVDGIFIPFFLSIIMVGCQSSIDTTSLNVSIKDQKTTVSRNLTEDKIVNSNVTPEISSDNKLTDLGSSDDSQKSNKVEGSDAVQQDLTDENINGIVELSDSENLVLNSSDKAISAQDPTALSSEGTSPSYESVLLCSDNTYYQSWVKQFNKNWLKENSRLYKKASKLNKAMTLARTQEFIRIVYPSIEKTGYDFPVEINPVVLSWIDYFRGAGRNNFVVWLKRSKSLLPLMEKTLEKKGLPKDLSYLSMIESGYNTKALSRVGAVGLWQFMPYTGREYGLKINDFVDERRSIKKSTEAASQFLSDLYTRFGSWHLAAASYNGGPRLVDKALRRFGSDSSFFKLTSTGKVNRETANYVPKLLAAMIISKNQDLFGFESNNISMTQPVVKTIPLKRSILLEDLATAMKVDKTILMSLNPELRIGITPPPHLTDQGIYELQVPESKYELAIASISNLPDAPTKRIIAARIKRKATLASFASRYHLNLASVLNENKGLKADSHLTAGKVIYIPVSLGTGQLESLTGKKYVTVKHKVHGKNSYKRRLVAVNERRSDSFYTSLDDLNAANTATVGTSKKHSTHKMAIKKKSNHRHKR